MIASTISTEERELKRTRIRNWGAPKSHDLRRKAFQNVREKRQESQSQEYEIDILADEDDSELEDEDIDDDTLDRLNSLLAKKKDADG